MITYKSKDMSNCYAINFPKHIITFHLFNFIRQSPLSNFWGKSKVKLSLQQAVKAHRFVRGRGSHIF
jgi:hypothetical protein